MEKANFQDVYMGETFHHNKIGYRKVSRHYAELVDNSVQNTVRNSYFDFTASVMVKARKKKS